MSNPENKKRTSKNTPAKKSTEKVTPRPRGISRLPMGTEDVYGSQRRVGQIQTSITLGNDLLKWVREEADRKGLHNVSAYLRQILMVEKARSDRETAFSKKK